MNFRKIIDIKDQLDYISPLQKEYQWYVNSCKARGEKPDPIMQWAREMHEASGYDPLEPDLIPIPFEETPEYEELNHDHGN